MKYLYLLFILTVFSSESLACSFASWEPFEPTLERWKQNPGPAQLDRSAEGEYWESAPAPIVSITKIIRASYKSGEPCSDAGLILMSVTLPDDSSYRIEEFGVYFRVQTGLTPDLIFPDTPVKGRIEGKKMILLFPWLDARPSKQYPLDLAVEATLVTNGLNIGKPTVFYIKQNNG
jgi:hypothetical protein